MSVTHTEVSPERFDEQLRADDRLTVVEADLSPDDPRMGSAQWWVTPHAMSSEAVLELLPEGAKGKIRSGKVILSLPP